MNKHTLTIWDDHADLTPSIGLWPQSGPGHTITVAALQTSHSGPDAASRLLALAAIGQAGEFFTPVLEALDRLQERDETSEFFGCCRWYHEEPHVTDTNAAFFIGLNLIVLHQSYGHMLNSENKACLCRVFEGLDVWFDRQVEHASPFYPNKFLGDLVCSWLLKEIHRREPSSTLLSVMRESGLYWKESPWGWGEHMSDPYATIMLNELSCLLLIARKLPEDLRQLYTALFMDLLAIDDAYAGGPRVPTIRSYAFNSFIPNAPFRSMVLPAGDLNDTFHNPDQLPHLRMFSFGDFFHRHGWHELAGSRQVSEKKVTIPCFGGTHATGHIESDFRIGSMSRYPIMPHTDYPTWGISWQSMPVAFSGQGMNWGLLRWHTRENSIDRYHPARDKHHAYLHNALTDVIQPPVVGETYSRQEAHRLVILRQMPRIVSAWQELGDGWDIVGFSGEVIHEILREGAWSRLHLRLLGGRELALFHFSLNSTCLPSLTQHGDRLSWRARASQNAIQNESRFCQLWLVGAPADPDPVVETLQTCHTQPLRAKQMLSWAVFPEAIDLVFGDCGWELETHQNNPA